jgi:hypothetical protein
MTKSVPPLHHHLKAESGNQNRLGGNVRAHLAPLIKISMISGNTLMVFLK